MEIVEFLFKSGASPSKGDIRRKLKNKSFSIDGVKCELGDEFEFYDEIKLITVEDFLTSYVIERDDERVMKNCLLKFGRSNFKTNELISIALKDVFMFSEGKKKHFILIGSK